MLEDLVGFKTINNELEMSGLAKKNEKVQLINAPKDILDTENMSEEESILPKKRKRVLETCDLVEIL